MSVSCSLHVVLLVSNQKRKRKQRVQIQQIRLLFYLLLSTNLMTRTKPTIYILQEAATVNIATMSFVAFWGESAEQERQQNICTS